MLLKTPHGNSIAIRIDVPEPSLNDGLPPLTLQLLVENAVKHNVALKEKLLMIDIYTNEDGRLVVKIIYRRKPPGLILQK
ncbi:MAG: hypothetical protein ABJB11_11130 [Ferruginibacter sp.]